MRKCYAIFCLVNDYAYCLAFREKLIAIYVRKHKWRKGNSYDYTIIIEVSCREEYSVCHQYPFYNQQDAVQLAT